MDLDTALRAYVADDPPTALTAGTVLAAGRRARRRRRAGVAAGTVAAGVAGALVVAALRPAPAPAPPQPAGPGWTSLDPGPFCAAAAGDAASRYTCYLQTAVPRRLPGVTFHRKAGTPAGSLPLQVRRDGDTFTASAVIADGGGAGTIGFSVAPAHESAATAAASCTPPVCTLHTGPHGEVVTVLRVGSPRAGKVELVNVRVYRGGTVIFASATNMVTEERADREAQVLELQTPTRTGLPMSVEALIEVVAVPELTLAP